MKERNEDVDRIVRERLSWLEREIADREKDIAGTEERLAKTKADQVRAQGERARLLGFLPSDFEERAEANDERE
jgi:hypothetical protein